MEDLVDRSIAHIEQYSCVRFIDSSDPEFSTLSPSGFLSIEEEGSYVVLFLNHIEIFEPYCLL